MSAGPSVHVDDRRASSGGDGDEEPPPALAEGLGELLTRVLAAEGVGDDAEAGLLLVDPEEIEALNREHLGGDGPTDVLSFPVDGVGSGEGWMVGDVIVCPRVAAAQASSHAGSVADELRLLVVHGGLHLCGWDHAGEAERRAMWERERRLMDVLGCRPSGDPWSEGEPGRDDTVAQGGSR